MTVGQPATFKAAATGGAASSFQWIENGTAIAGATGATYTTPVANSADNGDKYSVVAKVAGESIQSNYATLTVAAPASIKTVFVILMENHNWSSIKGSADAPYINNTLLHLGEYAISITTRRAIIPAYRTISGSRPGPILGF